MCGHFLEGSENMPRTIYLCRHGHFRQYPPAVLFDGDRVPVVGFQLFTY
jgi:hypothetical protein